MIHKVTVVLNRQLLTEPNHIQRLVVEQLGLCYVMPVVLLQLFHLLTGQVGAHLERQILDVIGAHIELQHLQAGSSGFIVEMVDFKQVDLIDISVRCVHKMLKLRHIVILRLND